MYNNQMIQIFSYFELYTCFISVYKNKIINKGTWRYFDNFFRLNVFVLIKKFKHDDQVIV